MNATALVDLSRTRDLARSGSARSIRMAAGLSLSEVGSAVGVAESTVFRWEHGERAPRGEAGLRYGELLEALIGRGAKR